MSPFTDDDLERLRKEIIRCERSRSSLPLGEMIAAVSPLELKALLSRLEAAENLVREQGEHLERGRNADGVDEAKEVWREAAGG